MGEGTSAPTAKQGPDSTPVLLRAGAGWTALTKQYGAPEPPGAVNVTLSGNSLGGP